MDEALTIEVRHEQGCAIVTVAGEINVSAVTPLRDRLLKWQPAAPSWWSIWGRLALSIPWGSLAGRRGEACCRARRHPAGGLRPAEDPPVGATYPAGPPDTAFPHRGRGPGVPGAQFDEPAFLAAQLWRLTSSGPGAARLVTRLESGGDDVLRAFPSLRVLHYREGQRPEERYLAQWGQLWAGEADELPTSTPWWRSTRWLPSASSALAYCANGAQRPVSCQQADRRSVGQGTDRRVAIGPG